MNINYKSSIKKIIFKEYLPAGIILSILSSVFNNNFSLNYIFSADFLYRLLLSIMFISVLGIFVSMLINHPLGLL